MPAISSEFLAIDRKARAKIPTQDIATRPVAERVCDFNDVIIPMSAEQAMLEAARCVHCPDPAPCVEACPAHNDIPSAMWLIEQFRPVRFACEPAGTLTRVRVCPEGVAPP